MASVFLAMSQAKVEDSITRKEAKSTCHRWLSYAYNGIRQIPASCHIVLLFNIMVILGG